MEQIKNKVERKMSWYAIRTQNNKEKYVIERIKAEVQNDNVNHIMGEYLIPIEKIGFMRNGKQIIREKIVYPGYIFLETSAVGELVNIMKNINGVAGFVKGRGGDISPLRKDEIEKIITDHTKANDVNTMKSLYIIGETVKVIDGAFSSFKGSIIDMDSNKKQVKIQISIFSRISEITLNFTQIEKIIE